MTNENWKDVVGYEGLYQVSDHGNVRNSKGKQLTQDYKQGTKYKRVHLSKHNVARHHSVHRLVAEAFLPRVEGKDIVNHLDHDKENNHVDNLEWTTKKDNSAYSASEGHYKVQYSNLLNGRGLLKKAVIATAPDGTVYEFESIAQASRILGIPRTHIGSACKKSYGRKTVHGYEWRYAS